MAAASPSDTMPPPPCCAAARPGAGGGNQHGLLEPQALQPRGGPAGPPLFCPPMRRLGGMGEGHQHRFPAPAGSGPRPPFLGRQRRKIPGFAWGLTPCWPLARNRRISSPNASRWSWVRSSPPATTGLRLSSTTAACSTSSSREGRQGQRPLLNGTGQREAGRR